MMGYSPWQWLEVFLCSCFAACGDARCAADVPNLGSRGQKPHASCCLWRKQRIPGRVLAESNMEDCRLEEVCAHSDKEASPQPCCWPSAVLCVSSLSSPLGKENYCEDLGIKHISYQQ